MDQHAQRHHETGDVGHHPAGIMDHLKDCPAVIPEKARLIEGVAAVVQRVVHENLYFALLVPGRVLDHDCAFEVFWNVRARVFIVREIRQFQRVIFIDPLGPHGDRISLAVYMETLWRELDVANREIGILIH